VTRSRRGPLTAGLASPTDERDGGGTAEPIAAGVLGGRAPRCDGYGSLQEIDTCRSWPAGRFAATAQSATKRVAWSTKRCGGRDRPSGVGFVDFPMDHVFSPAEDDGRPGALTELPAAATPDTAALDRAAAMLAAADRPVIMRAPMCGGTRERRCFALPRNGRFRADERDGPRVVPADHRLAFSRRGAKR